MKTKQYHKQNHIISRAQRYSLSNGIWNWFLFFIYLLAINIVRSTSVSKETSKRDFSETYPTDTWIAWVTFISNYLHCWTEWNSRSLCSVSDVSLFICNICWIGNLMIIVHIKKRNLIHTSKAINKLECSYFVRYMQDYFFFLTKIYYNFTS